MKKGRNAFAVDKAGTKHEKHKNTKRFAQATAEKPGTGKPAEPKTRKSS